MPENNTILIVDDEPDILSLTEKFLKHANFKTITASNGREALDIIEKKFIEIALVLLDIMMPGISGYSVLKEIKAKYKGIKVILFTIKSFTEDIQEGKRLGADGYINKPFSGTELIKCINEHLKK